MREVKIIIIATIFTLSAFSATWFCHSDLGNDAWPGESMDSAKASFGGVIAVAGDDDTILACGRNFNEAIAPDSAFTIDSWPDSARWKISYDSGYTMEGEFRLHNGVIEGPDCVKLVGNTGFVDSDSIIGAGNWYMLYISNTSACTLRNVATSGSTYRIMFIYTTPEIYFGENLSLQRDPVSELYPIQWSARNIAVNLETPASSDASRPRYWISSPLKALWFKP